VTTTDGSDGRFDADAELDAIHRELVSDIDSGDVPEPDSDDLADVERLLGGVDSTVLRPRVRRYLDAVLSGGEIPTADARSLLTAAARRSLAKRRTVRPLPILLQERRIARDESAARVAEVLGVDESRVAALEAGNASVSALPAQVIVHWIEHLELDPSVAPSSLARALTLTQSARTGIAAGASETAELSTKDRELVEEVRRLLTSGRLER